MKTEKTSFWLLLTETNPDTVIGCETWLHPGIYVREVLPENYHIVARKDRGSDHHGGVLITAKITLIGTHLDIQTNTEFAADPQTVDMIIWKNYVTRSDSSKPQIPEQLFGKAEMSTSQTLIGKPIPSRGTTIQLVLTNVSLTPSMIPAQTK